MNQEYKRIDFALNQLKTAIALFISNNDRFSVITLSGAADEILGQYVLRQGKKNHSQLSAELNDKSDYKEFGKEVNNLLCINALKHMDPGDDNFVEIDYLDACCIGAILKALVNYKILDQVNGGILVTAFHFWLENNNEFKHYLPSVMPT